MSEHPDPRQQLARRNARMAWFHAVLAASFLLAFFLMQAYR